MLLFPFTILITALKDLSRHTEKIVIFYEKYYPCIQIFKSFNIYEHESDTSELATLRSKFWMQIMVNRKKSPKNHSYTRISIFQANVWVWSFQINHLITSLSVDSFHKILSQNSSHMIAKINLCFMDPLIFQLWW